ADDPDIIIPKIYWQWTCERLNVQEYVEGIPGNDLDAVDAAGLDRKVLATLGANAVLKMILLDGLYHADPHPGNVLYLPENRIAFLDFGMAGRLSEGRRNQLLLLLDAIVNQRAMGAVDVLLDWAGETTANLETLEAEVEGFVERYHGIPLKQLRVASLLEDFTGLLRDNGLTLPPDLSVLIKALVTLEGLGRQLDPDFDMAAQSAPFVRQAMAARYAPDALLKRGQRAVQELAETLSSLPTDLRGAFRAARRGKLQVNIDMARLERFGHQIDGAASRLTVGIVTAALIVGSSIVMTVDRGPTVLGLPVFGLLGFLAASAGGVWLLISIWRGKHDRSDRF
ncbi:MAG: ubiquinone biosynthesis protein UbiB, partial [Alphaproteobacteria bacterium]|nr:ubiquinone biosynthesis protein UbiB [Alphaproteobacteria bacterium]